MADEKNEPVKLQKKSNLPVVDVTAPEEHDLKEEPPGEEDYGTTLFTNKRDGLKYALHVRKDEVRGKTHHARNSARYWNGTEAEFKDQFEKA